MTKKVLSFCLCLMLLLIADGKAQATSLLFHEDFHSLEEWSEIHNAQRDAPDNPCRDEFGPTVWKQTEFGFGAEILSGVPCFIVLASPLHEVPSSTVELSWQWYFTDPNQDRNFILHWQDAENWIGLHAFGSRLYVEGKDEGEDLNVTPGSLTYPFRAHTVHNFRVRENMETGEVLIWVNQVLLPATTLAKPHHIPFRPGLAASVGDGVRSSQSYFRDLQVWAGPTTLQPVMWKQTDSRWAEQEYDSATTWSIEAASIGRWGCALTSAAMILDAAGVRQLPSGLALNPGSLNEWLKSEPGGYIGPGLLNWRSIAQLALWHNQQFGTTKLEFSVPTIEDKNAWLRAQLDKRFPVILEQPQHFVVATQWEPNTLTATILDPAYERNSLTAYDDTFVSARLFTPSATNLQGATLVAPVWARLSATTALGDPVSLTPLESSPFDAHGEQSVSGWQMWDAPPWGLGPLLVTAQAPISVPLDGAWYSEDGQEFTIPAVLERNLPTRIDVIPPPQIISDQDFARLLSWQEISSPLPWLWRQKVLSSPTPELARQYRWLLDHAQQNHRLTPAAHALLLQEISASIPP